MKRGLLLLFLVLLPFSFALTDKIIYNNWILAGTSFIYENETYRVNYVKETNATIVYFPEGLTAVLYASSQNCTTEWIYTVCQSKQKFEIGKNLVDPDVHARKVNVSLFLKINKTDINLDFSKNYTPSSIFLTDKIEFRTQVKNNLLADFANVSFRDSFPEGFVIDEITGCWLDGNAVVWRGDLKKEKYFLCTYKVRPLKEGVFKNDAYLTYSVLEKDKIKTINYTLDIKPGPFSFGMNISNTTLKIEEPLLVNISLNALADFTLREITIALPKNYKIINMSPDFKLVNNNLSYDGKDMKIKDNVTLYFKSVSGFVNFDQINISVDYSYNYLVKEYKRDLFINYSDLIPEIYIYKRENESVLRISNIHNVSFKNIQINVDNLFFELPLLERRRYKEFTFPFLDDLKHNISLSYVSQYNQYLSHSFGMKYGENTGNKTELKEQPTEKKEPVREKKKFKINIDKGLLLIVGAVVLGTLIVVILFSLLKGKKKTDLDKEIEKIKKETEKLEEETK